MASLGAGSGRVIMASLGAGSGRGYHGITCCRLWEGMSSWKCSPAAAIIFSEIQPLGQAPADPVSISEPRSAEQFRCTQLYCLTCTYIISQ